MLKFKNKIIIFFVLSFFALSFSADAATISRPPTNLGLVGYWPMDEGVGTKALDLSGQGNTGTTSGATWTSGKRGKALSFNGNRDFLFKSSFSGDFTNGGTVSFWTNLNSLTASDGFVVSSQLVPLIVVDAGLRLLASVYNTGAVAGYQAFHPTDTIPLNQWVFYTITWDSNALKIYKNGVLHAQDTTITGTLRTSSGDMYIGNDRNSVGRSIDGKMDDVRIYNRALSQTEVSRLYASGQTIQKKVNESGLVGYWSMNEGGGTKVGDSSGRGNNGTITSSTWTSGKKGGALSFDGVNNLVNIGTASLGITDTMTVSAWVKSDTDISGRIAAKHTSSPNYGWMLSRDATSDRIQWSISTNGSDWNGGTTGNNTFLVGQWYFVTATYDGSFMRVFINGQEDTAGSFPRALSGNVNNSIASTLIGDDQFSSINFDGIIDDVRIYNRALSATEIKNLYKQSETMVNAPQNDKLTNGLVGFWSFNGKDVSGVTAYDRSGNGNNGTIYGGAAFDGGKVGQGLNFPGSGTQTRVEIAPSASINDLPNLSVSLWAKGQIDLNDGYIGKYDDNSGEHGWVFSNGASGAVYFAAAFGGAADLEVYTASNSVIQNQWAHWVVTWDGSTTAANVHIYRNGIELSHFSNINGDGSYTSDSARPIFIGNGRDNMDWEFKGTLDEVRLYNRILSASEVKQLYLMGK